MLKLSHIGKIYDEFALTDINIEIQEGEYYILLGRSGSGKTQLLELIAGLEKVDTGDIYLDEENITRKRIQDRKIGIVFQDYAMFPHMTVFENIAYSLKSIGNNYKSLNSSVNAIAGTMNISHLLNRKTDRLSSGELQRVALARTLITSPRLLLLDEPLSSLDASLKDDMKKVLRKLNKSGQTIVHVTHDYSEAISLAKKVGVIHNGRIIQEGTPSDVFKNPVNRFVARYSGIRNFFKVDFINNNSVWTCLTKNILKFKMNGGSYPDNGMIVLRSNEIKVSSFKPEDPSLNSFIGIVEDILPSEHGIEVTINAGEIFFVDIPVQSLEKNQLSEGVKIWLSFPSSAVLALPGKN
jgi:molybdate/tungstate transport system ATP-binding protein